MIGGWGERDGRMGVVMGWEDAKLGLVFPYNALGVTRERVEKGD
jgi:hypothetical protein